MKKRLFFAFLLAILIPISAFSEERYTFNLGASFFNYSDSKELAVSFSHIRPIGYSDYWFYGFATDIGGNVDGYSGANACLVSLTGLLGFGISFNYDEMRISAHVECGVTRNQSSNGLGATAGVGTTFEWFLFDYGDAGLSLSYLLGCRPNEYFSGEQRYFDKVSLAYVWKLD